MNRIASSLCAVLFACLLTLPGVGCSSSASDSPTGSDLPAGGSDPSDSLSLRVAVMPTIDCLPLFVAQQSGLFDSLGVSVSLCPFMAQMDCDTALVGGFVQAAATDLVRAERLQRQGLTLRYLAATDLHWQLITARQARIRQLKQMDDKMVAMTRYSATAMLADQLTDSAKLVPERVFRIQVNDVGVRLSMLETGVMDAMFLPEPQATVARTLGSEVLYDTRQADLRMGALVLRESPKADSLRSRQADVLMQAYARACDSINHHGVANYAQLLARCSQVPEWAADSLPADVRFSRPEPPRQTDIDKARAWLDKH